MKTHKLISGKTGQFITVGVLLTLLTLGLVIYTWPRPDDSPPIDVVISLERNACFGTCPDYQLTILGDGTVVYQGNYHVAVEGQRTTTLRKEKVRALIAEFDRISFFALQDEYITPAFDMASATISITLNGQCKTIYDYGSGAAPPELVALEKMIDETVNVTQWVGTSPERNILRRLFSALEDALDQILRFIRR